MKDQFDKVSILCYGNLMKWLVGEITTGCNDTLIKYELDKVSFGELASCQGGKLTGSDVEKIFNFMKWQTHIMTSYRNVMLTNCQFGKMPFDEMAR